MMTCLPFPAAMRPNSTLSTGMFTTPPRSTRPYLARASSMLIVSRIDPRTGNVSLRIGTGPESTEAMLASSEQIRTEELVEGQHVKVYVVEVRRSTRGPGLMSIL